MRPIQAHQGQAHLALLLRQLERTKHRLADLPTTIEDSRIRDIQGRELRRLLQEVDILHTLIAEHRQDFMGQQPLGLLHLAHSTVDQMVSAPSGVRTELMIHLDVERNYQVVDLRSLIAESYQEVLPAESVFDKPTLELDSIIQSSRVKSVNHIQPLVLFLPALDPSNGFLAPMIAHEVGHVLVAESLYEEIEDWLAEEALTDLYRSLIERARDGRRDRSKATLDSVLYRWLEELVCDTLACLVAGPSWVLAASAFLRGPATDASDSHPPPQLRIAWAMRVLESNGWNDWMRHRFPDCTAYLLGLDSWVPEDASSAYLQQALLEQFDRVIRVAGAAISTPLTPIRFNRADSEHELCLAISRGYVPPKLGQDPPTPWIVLLAAWSAHLEAHDSPLEIPKLVGDEHSNEFLVRVFELVGIAGLWGRDDA